MTIFLPPPTNDTRSAFALADSVAVVQFICGLATFSTTVSNGARLAVLTDPGARLVKVKSPSSMAGPLVGNEPPLIDDGEPMMATLTDCPGCGVAPAEGLRSATSPDRLRRTSMSRADTNRLRF